MLEFYINRDDNNGDGYLFETETKPYYTGLEQYSFLLKG